MVVILIFVTLVWKLIQYLFPVSSKLILQKLKWVLIYGYLKFTKRKLKPMFSFDHTSTDIAKLGVISPEDAYLKENPRQLLSDDNAIDSIHLWGCDLSGNVLVVNISRRHGRQADVYVYLRLENGDEYQLPNQPDVQVFNTDGKSFSIKGLSFECLEALRIWRVNFNGRLRKGVKNQWDTDENDTVLVRLNSIWHPMNHYSAFPLDFNVSLMSDILCKHPWTKDILKNYHIGTTEWHEQWGQLHGTVKIDDKEHKLLLIGTKFREHGICRLNTSDKWLSIKGFSSISLGFNLYGKGEKDGNIQVFTGQVAPPSCEKLFSVKDCHIDDIEKFFEDDGKGKEVRIKLNADLRKYDITIKLGGTGFNVFIGNNWNHHGKVVIAEMTINGKKGIGIVETYQRQEHGSPLPERESLPQLVEPDNIQTDELVLSLHDNRCQSSKIVGGKGSSLALLMTIKDKTNQIPPGICLTKIAFECHLKANPEIKQAILDLQDVAWKRKLGKLEDECQKVEHCIKKSRICEELSNTLRNELKEVFGDSFVDLKFAVRSSAIGEDSEDLSAAGQNSTFLGVKTFNKICEAVLKCWGSQFSFQSVEYKRQNGQLLNNGMGVVVQKMVPADVAGVLFTRDPITGSMDMVTITSNYGLGESVVSASVNPDMILLNRSWNDSLSVCDKLVGKKEFKIVMLEKSVEGIVQTLNSAEDSSKCTLTDEMACRLGKIAICIENYFGSPRDVEWAIGENEIYLLQARPVTSGSAALTRFDVFHEFDTTLRTPHEHFSKGNVGEVMPGALSTLSLSGNMRAHGILFAKRAIRKIKNFRYDPSVMEGGGAVFYNHIFFDLIQLKMGDTSEEKSVITTASEVGLYGRILDDKEIVKIAKERYENPPLYMKLFMIRMMVPGMVMGNKIVAQMERTCADYRIPGENAQTAVEVFEDIMNHAMDVDGVLFQHLQVTFASMLWNTLVLLSLSGGTSNFNPDHYSDFASLIGSNLGAESGDVPVSLKNVALEIAKEMDSDQFSLLTPEDALSWLMKNGNSASVKFQEFLKKHGHRGVKEVMLKVPLVSSNKESMSVADCLKGMKTNMPYYKKKLLEWLVHRSRNAVCYREKAKSWLIYQHHQQRLAVRHLAKLLVNEGYIPDEEYVHFFSMAEIKELLKTRSPRLIMRARCRKRYYNEMDSLKFPEISVGFPVSINSDTENFVVDNVSQVTGLPVCYGVVKGVARVITSFTEVDTIQPKEILITQATDIGWSPYFPIIGGVVTEIGGLVSHGAVVAREYGLPCIIGAENATKVFKSGDVVLLDATNGKIMKIIE